MEKELTLNHKNMKFICSIILVLTLNFGFAQTYTIKNLELNDDKSQYGVVFYKGDKVYYTSYMLDNRNRARRDQDKRLIFTMFEAERKFIWVPLKDFPHCFKLDIVVLLTPD